VWQYAREHELALESTIDSSRLRRAWETANLMARELERLGCTSLRIEEFDDLAERGLGAAANLTIEEIEAVLAADPRFEVPVPGWKRDPTYVLPLQGAESLEQAGRRVAKHVLARSRALAGRSLKMFVGHGGAFRHAARELGLLTSDQAQALSMHHGAPIFLEHRADGHGDRVVHTGGAWRERSAAAAAD
jgi:2,3-bisphosphoglycerate-dependent phosphoglycerate mutase